MMLWKCCKFGKFASSFELNYFKFEFELFQILKDDAVKMPANLENSTVATGLEKVSFHSHPKERQCKFSSLQSLSHLQLCDPMDCSMSGFPVHHNSQSLLRLMFIESVMPSKISSSVIPFSSCPQSFPVSGSFTNESALRIRWLKYWSYSFNISPSNEHWGLIFRTDWLDLLAVQGTLKYLLQHQSSVQSLSHVRLLATPWTATCQASLSITNSWSLPKFMAV